MFLFMHCDCWSYLWQHSSRHRIGNHQEMKAVVLRLRLAGHKQRMSDVLLNTGEDSEGTEDD